MFRLRSNESTNNMPETFNCKQGAKHSEPQFCRVLLPRNGNLSSFGT